MTTRLHRRRAARGFTLIELMIVIVILCLLATIVMPRILDKPDQARRAKAMIEIKNIEAALAFFKADTGRFPTTAEGLAALVSDPGVKGYSAKGYFDQLPADPWGNPYYYLCPGLHGKDYDILSFGKDGEKGGEGDDADLESWNLDKTH